MLNDHELFIQLCEKNSILPPIKVSEEIKSSSNTGVLNLSNQSIIVPVCEILSQVICSSTTIHSVNLADCMLLSKSLVCILNALSEGSTVTSLNLKGNNISGSTVEHLGQLFLRNNTIKELCLDWNSVGSELTFFSQFCEGLSKNHCIEKLDLRYNQISPQCAPFLSKLIRANKILKNLDLAWNTLGLQGGKQVMEGLKENATLIGLDLRGNCVPNEILQAAENRTYENQRRKALYEVNGKKLPFRNNERHFSLSDSDSLSQERVPYKKSNPKKIRKKPKISPLQLSSGEGSELIFSSDSDAKMHPEEAKLDLAKNKELRSTEKKIEELNLMMQERVRVIEVLTRELKERSEENETNKVKINELQTEKDEIKQDFEKCKAEKAKDIEEIKKSYEESGESDRNAHRELKDSFKKLTETNKNLEATIRTYEKDLRKNSFEIQGLKKKLSTTTQSYEDLIAKNRTEVHRLKREIKEREARLKIEIGMLKTSLRESTEALETCQTQLQKSRVEIREVLENETNLKGKLAETERIVAKYLRYEDAFLKIKEDKENLEENYASAQRNIANLQRQLASLQAELIEPQRKYDLLKEELQQEKKRVVKFEQEILDERNRLKEKDEQIKNFATQISSLNMRILELQESHANEIKEKDKEKQQLQENLNKKERELNYVKAEEVKRTSHLYAAFSKYFGSIDPSSIT